MWHHNNLHMVDLLSTYYLLPSIYINTFVYYLTNSTYLYLRYIWILGYTTNYVFSYCLTIFAKTCCLILWIQSIGKSLVLCVLHPKIESTIVSDTYWTRIMNESSDPAVAYINFKIHKVKRIAILQTLTMSRHY